MIQIQGILILLNSRILLITPPPVDPERWCQHKSASIPDRSVSNTRLYKDACLDVGANRNVVVLDTWKLYLGDEECTPVTVKNILVDGLHLDIKGNMMLADEILDCIKRNWPELFDILPAVVWHDKIGTTASLFNKVYKVL